MKGKKRKKAKDRKGTELANYESVQKWIESRKIRAKAKGKDLADVQIQDMLRLIDDYVVYSGLDPDQLIKEAENVHKAYTRMSGFHNWLRGLADDGETKLPDEVDKTLSKDEPRRLKGKRQKWKGARATIATIRGFYSHSDIAFGKRHPLPGRITSRVQIRDEKTPLYSYDEASDEIHFNNGPLRSFLSHLPSDQDRTIALSLLSTGSDAADLLRLNVEFIRDKIKVNFKKAIGSFG